MKRSFIIITSIVLSIVLGLTYATFIVSTSEYNVAEMMISNLVYGIEVLPTEPNQNINGKKVTVSANTKTVVKVKITSINLQKEQEK